MRVRHAHPGRVNNGNFNILNFYQVNCEKIVMITIFLYQVLQASLVVTPSMYYEISPFVHVQFRGFHWQTQG